MPTEPDFARELAEILSRYSGASSELIPILQEVQEKFGYLPAEVMQRVAKFLRLTDNMVYGVSTFYAQFKLTPLGRRIVKVCRGTACHVRGGAKILDEVEKTLGVKAGGTSGDMEYTLETIACFGSCALAPVVVIDDVVHGRVTTSSVRGIITGMQ